MQWVGVASMTDMIARDLQDMARHPARTVLALIMTIITMLACPVSCVVTIFFALGR